jgi:hypothetical protein
MRLIVRLFAAILLGSALSGCAVVSIAGAVAGAAVDVGTTAVGVGADAVGAAAGAVTGSSSDDEKKPDKS